MLKQNDIFKRVCNTKRQRGTAVHVICIYGVWFVIDGWMSVECEFGTPPKASVVFLKYKKLYLRCSVLVDSRNRFQCDLIIRIKLKYNSATNRRFIAMYIYLQVNYFTALLGYESRPKVRSKVILVNYGSARLTSLTFGWHADIHT